MNKIIGYNEHHDTTTDTGCYDINNNEYKTKECNLNEIIQPAQLSQDEYLNEDVIKDEEGVNKHGKKKCICGSVLLKSVFTNTRKYYNEEGNEYLHIKTKWVCHTTSCINHKIFKSLITYIFYKRRYNKLSTVIKKLNKRFEIINTNFQQYNPVKKRYTTLKGNTNKGFLIMIDNMKKSTIKKIKDNKHDANTPIRESTINKVYYSTMYKKRVKELRNSWSKV